MLPGPMTLPVVRLPEAFCKCLRLYNPGQSLDLDEVAKILWRSPGVVALLERCFPEMKKEKRPDWLIRSMGWPKFRNRLSSLYVFRCYEGFWPEIYDEALVEDILRFEETFSAFGLLGHSRIFLLGLYYKVAKLKGKGETPLMDEAALVHIFRQAKARSERPDQLLIFCWNLLGTLSAEQIVTIIGKQDHDPFQNLWKELSAQVKLQVARNFLRYGYSTHEAEFFTQKVIWEGQYLQG